MSANRLLAMTFLVLAVLQTAVPILAQKLTRAIVFRHFLHVAIVSCVVTAIVVTLYQVMHRRFGAGAMVAFYIGSALLIVFDILMERAIDASC
ncbi:MAG: hypothetical protein ABR915_24075 [Thermoguttaceae bacterium]|jgi:hypothetical protein